MTLSSCRRKQWMADYATERYWRVSCEERSKWSVCIFPFFFINRLVTFLADAIAPNTSSRTLRCRMRADISDARRFRSR